MIRKVFVFFCLFAKFSLLSQIKLPIKEIGEKYVGRFLSEKNIEIQTSNYDVTLLVNQEGYCYATEYSIDKILRKNDNLNELNFHIGENLIWKRNSDMIFNSVNFLEFMGLFGLSDDSESAYYSFEKGIPNCKGYASTERYHYIVLENEEYYLLYVIQNKEVNPELHKESHLRWEKDFPGKFKINDEYLNIRNFENPLDYFESNSFKEIEAATIQKHTLKIETDRKLLALPLSTFELPFGFYFGFSELDFFTFLKKKFQSIDREQRSIGVYGEINVHVYIVNDGNLTLRIESYFYLNKMFKVYYSFDKNLNFIYERLCKKICDLKNKYPSVIYSRIDCEVDSNGDNLNGELYGGNEYGGIEVTWLSCLNEIESFHQARILDEKKKLLLNKKSMLDKL